MHSPASHLDQEVDAARALLDLLGQEQERLVKADMAGLSALTEQKTAVVARMAELAQSRYSALAAANFSDNEAGMQAWLRDTCPQSDQHSAATRNAWVELLALAQSAKQINRTNGILINTHMMRNQTALSILQGNPQGNNLYGPDGQSSTKTEARGVVVG